MSPRNVLSVAALIAALLFPVPASAATPVIEVTPDGLRVVGLTPGADAVWFGASIETLAMTPLLKRHAALIKDADRDGTALFAMPKKSRYMLVFVIDSETGAYATYRGEGVKESTLEVTANAWRTNIEQFDVTADTLHILLVRPGTGAWAVKAIDGGANDGDATRDVKFRLKLKDMEPLTGDAKPHGTVRRGDVLVMIDPHTLAYAVRAAAE